MTQVLPDIELETIEGQPLLLPKDNNAKLTLLVFVEPPADPTADFPVNLDKKGEPTKNDHIRKVMEYAEEFTNRHVHKEVDLLVAFLGADAERARKLMADNEWAGRPVLVPDGLDNSMVRQLGILSADQMPNVLLLRRDGTIAWQCSGFIYKSDFGYPFAARLAIKVHIEVADTELAFRALENGDFAEAKRIFTGPFLPEKDERYRWRAPRFHGRAIAQMGLKDWEGALADIDIAIEAYHVEWDRPDDEPSESLLRMHKTRAAILEKLGRTADAKTEAERAGVDPSSYSVWRYDRFQARLEEVRLNLK